MAFCFSGCLLESHRDRFQMSQRSICGHRPILTMSSDDEQEFNDDEAFEPSPIKSSKNDKKEGSDFDDEDDVPLKSMVKKKQKKPVEKRRKAKQEEDGDDEDIKPAKKKRKSSSHSTVGPKKSPTKDSKRTLKKLDRTERLQYAMQSFLWWDAPEPPAGCQWRRMEHAGVSFPEPYVPHGVCMKYEGKPIELTPIEEEAATFFAAMDPDGMHLGDPKTAKIFIKNYFADFRDVLGKGHVVKVGCNGF